MKLKNFGEKITEVEKEIGKQIEYYIERNQQEELLNFNKTNIGNNDLVQTSSSNLYQNVEFYSFYIIYIYNIIMQNSVINETKLIIDKINEKILESNKKYYNDVLNFLNMIFLDESKSILKINCKKISFNKDILEIYNYIIKKHKLNKDLIDIDYFDFETEYDHDDVIKIILQICNNSLEKLNYQMSSYTYNDKKIIKIKMIKK